MQYSERKVQPIQIEKDDIESLHTKNNAEDNKEELDENKPADGDDKSVDFSYSTSAKRA